MLRSIKTPYNRVRMMGVVATTTSSPSASASVGNPDILSISRSAQGQVTIVPRVGGALTPIILGSPGADQGNSNFVGIEASTTKNSYVATAYDTTSTGDDGTLNLICLNYGSPFEARGPLQEITAAFNKPRFLPVRIDGVSATPVVEEGKRQISVVRADVTGDYQVTITKPFAKTPVVLAIPDQATIASCRVTSQSKNTFKIQTFNTTNTLTNAVFNLWVLGQDAPQEVGLLGRNAVQTPNRKTRVLGFFVLNTAGAYSILRNSQDATIEDLGTGNFRITYQKPSVKKPVIVSNGIGAFRCQPVAHTTVTSGGKTFWTKTEFKVTNAAGTVQDQSAGLGIALFDDNFNY